MTADDKLKIAIQALLNIRASLIQWGVDDAAQDMDEIAAAAIQLIDSTDGAAHD